MREQRNTASKEAVRLRVVARRERELKKEERFRETLVREAELRRAITRKPRSLAERELDALIERAQDEPLRALLCVISARAPKLTEMTRAFQEIAKLPFVRSPETWKPRGKGRETLFRSLCEHVLARFRMPPFLWSAFFEADAGRFGPFVAFVAGGGSVHDGIKKGLLPVPLTRKMCHDFMQTPADVPFFKALRRTEVRASGGDAQFLAAWMGSQAGRRLHTAEEEAFWMTVIDWFAKNPMADRNQVGPLVDYILDRRRMDPDFSMKGRSVLAMMRGAQQWHEQLGREKAIHGAVFTSSGWKPLEATKTHRDTHGNFITELWRVDEITTLRALADEGRKQSHCVYSYAGSIEAGLISIWSLNVNEEKAITVEVRNDIRRIVQARGRFNRQATAREFTVLTQWAGMNDLEIRLGHG